MSDIVTVTWYGQSMFGLATPQVTVVTDPFGSGMGYRFPEIAADVVTVSHDHFDHNNVGGVSGSPAVLRDAGTWDEARVRFRGIAAYHDSAQGGQRGRNIMFRFELATVTFSHLGDLGQESLLPQQLEVLAGTDVLFVPVGGRFTIDGGVAVHIVGQVEAKVAIPMHYGTDADTIGLAPVDRFAEAFPGRVLKRPSTLEISAAGLPSEAEAWIMDYET